MPVVPSILILVFWIYVFSSYPFKLQLLLFIDNKVKHFDAPFTFTLFGKYA